MEESIQGSIPARALTFLEERCFNLHGLVSREDYDAQQPEEKKVKTLFPWAETIFLVGTGGRGFWESLSPKELERSDPIDSATKGRLESFPRISGEHQRWIFPFGSEAKALDFRRLGDLAGFGALNTVLGVLIHPVYGPWVSLRGALLMDQKLEPSKPMTEFDPCAPCEKPCISACPALAIRVTGVEFDLCGNHLMKSTSCDDGCLSRRACVYGQDEMYSTKENNHRQKSASHTLKNWILESRKS